MWSALSADLSYGWINQPLDEIDRLTAMVDGSLPTLLSSRHRDRLSDDRGLIREILYQGMVAHLGFIREGWPVVLPFHYGLGDLGDGRGVQMIVHGSSGGTAFLDAAATKQGVAVSICVSFNDALVLGRSTYNTGAHFRSVVAYGHAHRVPDEQRLLALDYLMDHILPGRRAEVRTATTKEIVATALIAIPLDHASAKVANTSTGEAPDDGEDREIWAGVIPLSLRAGEPRPAPETAHPLDLPESARRFITRLNEQ